MSEENQSNNYKKIKRLSKTEFADIKDQLVNTSTKEGQLINDIRNLQNEKQKIRKDLEEAERKFSDSDNSSSTDERIFQEKEELEYLLKKKEKKSKNKKLI